MKVNVFEILYELTAEQQSSTGGLKSSCSNSYLLPDPAMLCQNVFWSCNFFTKLQKLILSEIFQNGPTTKINTHEIYQENKQEMMPFYLKNEIFIKDFFTHLLIRNPKWKTSFSFCAVTTKKRPIVLLFFILLDACG